MYLYINCLNMHIYVSDHCMVSFVKPNLLGTSKEFRNRFVNPITNGQCADSTAHDVKIMKRRAHILHEKLNGCVQVQFTVQLYCSKEMIYSSHSVLSLFKKKYNK